MTDEERAREIIKHHGHEMSSAGKQVMGLVIIEAFAAVRADQQEIDAGRGTGHHRNRARDTRVLEMRRNGMKFREIAEALGVHTSRARGIFLRANAAAIRAMGDKGNG